MAELTFTFDTDIDDGSILALGVFGIRFEATVRRGATPKEAVFTGDATRLADLTQAFYARDWFGVQARPRTA